MAYYSLFPEIDSTIYSHPDRKLLNTGGDEILEVVKEKYTDQKYYPSRILIKFKNEEIKDVISSTIGSSTFNSDAKVGLELFQTEAKNLTTILNLEAFAVSQSWHEGKGRYSNLPTSSNGVTWVFRDNDIAQTKWPTGSALLGATFGSSSIIIKERPSGSAHKLTINGIDFIPVISSSLFTSDSPNDVFVDISGSSADNSLKAFGENLRDAINASSSLTLVSASFTFTSPLGLLALSGSNTGSVGNITVTTSSITVQPVFTGPTGLTMTLQGGTDTVNQNFYPGSTGSLDKSLLTAGGGTWWTGSGFSSVQQFLNAETLDINFDVTDIVKKHSASLFAGQIYPDGIENNGFIIKQPDSVETSTSSSFGEMQYFSVDTHTIFPPKLTFKWDDSVHNFQSSAKNSGELNVTLYNTKKEFNQNDIAKFKVHVRDKYPTRNFVTSSNFLNVGYFTTSSFYSIRDAFTEEEIIPFDNEYTKMSADEEGMFFKIYMRGLQPERYYRVLFKHINNDGTVIYDDNYTFKVIR